LSVDDALDRDPGITNAADRHERDWHLRQIGTVAKMQAIDRIRDLEHPRQAGTTMRLAISVELMPNRETTPARFFG
jgi:hypothetical protein